MYAVAGLLLELAVTLPDAVRRHSRQLVVAAVLAATVLVFAAGSAVGAGVWRKDSPYVAKVRCSQMAEDTATTLELVQYERLSDGSLKLVYSC